MACPVTNIAASTVNGPEMIEIRVHGGASSYHVDKVTLQERSRRVRNHLNTNVPHPPALALPHVSRSTISSYLIYVQSRTLACIDHSGPRDFGRELTSLMRLYVLAAELEDSDAKDAAATGVVVAYRDAVLDGRGDDASVAPSHEDIRQLFYLDKLNDSNQNNAILSTWPKPTGDRIDRSQLELIFVDLYWFERQIPPHVQDYRQGLKKRSFYTMVCSSRWRHEWSRSTCQSSACLADHVPPTDRVRYEHAADNRSRRNPSRQRLQIPRPSSRLPMSSQEESGGIGES